MGAAFNFGQGFRQASPDRLNDMEYCILYCTFHTTNYELRMTPRDDGGRFLFRRDIRFRYRRSFVGRTRWSHCSRGTRRVHSFIHTWLLTLLVKYMRHTLYAIRHTVPSFAVLLLCSCMLSHEIIISASSLLSRCLMLDCLTGDRAPSGVVWMRNDE